MSATDVQIDEKIKQKIIQAIKDNKHFFLKIDDVQLMEDVLSFISEHNNGRKLINFYNIEKMPEQIRNIQPKKDNLIIISTHDLNFKLVLPNNFFCIKSDTIYCPH